MTAKKSGTKGPDFFTVIHLIGAVVESKIELIY